MSIDRLSEGLTDGGGASRHGGSGSLVEAIRRSQAPLWSLQVGVGVHPPGDHQLTVRIHRLHADRDDQVLADLPDEDT